MQKRGVFLLFLAAFLLYGAMVYDHQFVGDDHYQIVENPFVQKLSNLPRLFHKSYLSSLEQLQNIGLVDVGSGELTYRPVCTLSYFSDHALWRLDPRGYHLTNLLLHVFNACLVFLLLLRSNVSRTAAVAGALIFFFHPVNAEVVAVISSRDDSLAFLFYGLALLLYQKFRDSGFQNLGVYALSVGGYVLAVFSKETGITLPLMIMLYDWCFPDQRTSLKQRAKFYAGYGVVAGIYLLIWFFVMQPSAVGMIDYFAGNPGAVVLTIVRIVTLYAVWLAAPFNIPPANPDPSIVVHVFFAWETIVAGIFVVGTGFLIWRAYVRREKQIVFGFLWILIALLPVLCLPKMLNVLYAPRFLYIPMIGFCVIVAVLLNRLKNRFADATKIGLVLFYLILLSIHVPVWKDDLRLGLERLNYYPQNSTAALNLGLVLEKQGNLNAAFGLYNQAVAMDPSCVECLNRRGVIYLKTGRSGEAEENFRQALKLAPDFLPAEQNLCDTFGQSGRFSAAVVCFEGIISRNKGYIPAYYDLGITYARSRQKAQALKVWQEGLAFDPASPLLLEAIRKMANEK